MMITYHRLVNLVEKIVNRTKMQFHSKTIIRVNNSTSFNYLGHPIIILTKEEMNNPLKLFLKL